MFGKYYCFVKMIFVFGNFFFVIKVFRNEVDIKMFGIFEILLI